jgi:hypothetical protein
VRVECEVLGKLVDGDPGSSGVQPAVEHEIQRDAMGSRLWWRPRWNGIQAAVGSRLRWDPGCGGIQAAVGSHVAVTYLYLAARAVP